MVAVGGVKCLEGGIVYPGGEMGVKEGGVSFERGKLLVEIRDNVVDEEGFVVGHEWEVFVEEFSGAGEVIVFKNGGESGLGREGWREVFFVRVVRGASGVSCKSGGVFGHFVDFVWVPKYFLRWGNPSIL